MKNSKERCLVIEGIFEQLQATKNYVSSANELSKELSALTDKYITVTFVQNRSDSPLYLMCICPDDNTIDELVTSIIENRSTTKAVWKKQQAFLLEIDVRIFTLPELQFTPKEITALILHEIGHMVEEDRFLTRAQKILSLEYAKMSTGNQNIIKSSIFKPLLSIPIIQECIIDENDIYRMKKEEKADSYAVKLGYGKELKDVIGKVILYYKKHGSKIINQTDGMVVSSIYVNQIIEDLKKRDKSIVVGRVSRLCDKTSSPFLKKKLLAIRYALHRDVLQESTDYEETFVTANRLYECAYRHCFEEGLFTKLFKKKLKPLDWDAINYVLIKNNDVYRNSDKLLLASYASSKLSDAKYYLEILQKDPESKRYIVPHTIEEVKRYISEMEKALQTVLNNRYDKRWTIYVDNEKKIADV